MKRIISLILTVLLTLSMLAGCGGEEKLAQSTEPVQADRPLSLGVVEGNTYINTYAGMGCTLEDGWTMLTAEELQDLSKIVSDDLEGTDIGANMEEGQQFCDMKAESADMMMNMNVIIQKQSKQDRASNKLFSEEEIVDLVLGQKDLMADSYASSGMTLVSMEKVVVNFLGEKHFAVKFEISIQGVPYYQLQISNFHLGEYAVVATMTSIMEDNTESMLEMFYAVE